MIPKQQQQKKNKQKHGIGNPVVTSADRQVTNELIGNKVIKTTGDSEDLALALLSREGLPGSHSRAAF